jgi:hypothetical protein
MSRAPVDELLGIPPYTAAGGHAPEYRSWLGRERGFISIDSEWLELTFSDDVVVKALVRPD